MPTPPPRKRFQFHLSTAIVMMFVAGGIIWANLFPIENSFESYIEAPYDFKDVPVNEVIHTFQQQGRDTFITGLNRKSFGRPVWAKKSYQNLRIELHEVKELSTPYQPKYSQIGIAIDLVVAITILVAVWFLCEYLIRRRAAQKKA